MHHHYFALFHLTMILQRHRAPRLMAHLLLHVKRHFQPVRKLGLLPQIVRCPAFGRLLFASKQWGTSTNDPGMGSAVFSFPVTCNPCIALAGTTKLGSNNYANDAVIISFETTECKIDSTNANYVGNFRVVVIGRN